MFGNFCLRSPKLIRFQHRIGLAFAIQAFLLVATAQPLQAQTSPSVPQAVEILTPQPQSVVVPPDSLNFIAGGPEKWTSPEGLSSSLQIVLLLTVLSLAPAVLLMTTCYVRIIIVLGLLRQAIGLQS